MGQKSKRPIRERKEPNEKSRFHFAGLPFFFLVATLGLILAPTAKIDGLSIVLIWEKIGVDTGGGYMISPNSQFADKSF